MRKKKRGKKEERTEKKENHERVACAYIKHVNVHFLHIHKPEKKKSLRGAGEGKGGIYSGKRRQPEGGGIRREKKILI